MCQEIPDTDISFVRQDMQMYRNNTQIILQQIKDNGPISKRELQEITGYSWGLISQVTNRLAEQGYIVAEEDKESVGVGRKAEKFDIIKTNNYFIGVDFDSRGMLLLVTDMKGRVIESLEHQWKVKTRKNVLEELFAVLDIKMAQYTEQTILGIGFAVQGVVDVMNGVSVYINRIEEWRDVPLRQLVQERYSVDVVIFHDPDCLMETEKNFGVLKNCEMFDVLMIHFNYGFGIGMSIMINGQIYLGHHGRAGELGYAILGENGNGESEILDQYISKKKEEMDTEKICGYIAQSVAVANSFFNPAGIVLHTINCDYEQQLFDAIDKKLRNSSYDTTVSLKLSRLERDAKAMGSALIIIDRTIKDVI